MSVTSSTGSQKIEWKIVVDDDGAVAKMEELRKVAGKTEKDMEGVGSSAAKTETKVSRLGTAFGRLKSGAALAAGGLVAAGSALAVSSFEKTDTMGEEVEKLHSLSGMTYRESMLFAAATKARGLNINTTAAAYKYLGKNMKAAEVQQESYENSQLSAIEHEEVFRGRLGLTVAAFNKLGVTVGQLRHMNPDEQFKSIIKAFGEMKDGAEKTRLETQLFGRGGTQMSQVLDDNALGLQHMLKVAEKAFPYLGENGMETMENLKVKTAESKLYWEGLQVTLGLKLVPAINAVLPKLVNMVREAEKGQGIFGAIATELKDAADAMGWIKARAGAVEKLFGLSGKGTALESLAGALLADKLIMGGMGRGAISKILKGLGGGMFAKDAEKGIAGKLAKSGASTAVKDAEKVGAGAAGASAGPVVAAGVVGGAGGYYLGHKYGASVLGHVVNPIAGLFGKRLENSAEHERRMDEIARRNEHHAEQMRMAVEGFREHYPGVSISLDGAEIGKILSRNPKAMHELAKGVERQANFRAARH